MSSNQPPPIPPHGTRRPQVHWNSDITDLSCHRLTPEELSRKLVSRQSHNLAIARATLLSAGAGSHSTQPFTPALAARLRAATEQSLECVIAECNAAVNNSQRIRQSLTSSEADAAPDESAMSNEPNTGGGEPAPSIDCDHSSLANGDSDNHTYSDKASEDCIQSRITSPPTSSNTNATVTSNGLAMQSCEQTDVPSTTTSANAGDCFASDVPSYVTKSDARVRPSSAPTHSELSFDKMSSSASITGVGLIASTNCTTASSHSFAQRFNSSRYPLITANGNNLNTNTYSSISSILRAKHSRNNSLDHKNSLGGSITPLSFRSSSTSPGPSSDASQATKLTNTSQYQYTEDPEEARLEHEKELERLKEDCRVESPPVESLQEALKLAQQPNRNLDKTLELVVSTCEALWTQLQQERQTRQQLQEHLQRQGAVIGDLTSELLQIQEQQEDILQEVQMARTSLLWQLAGVEDDCVPEDLLMRPPHHLTGTGGMMGLLGRALPPSSLLAAAATENEEHRLSSSAPPSFYPSLVGRNSPMHFPSHPSQAFGGGSPFSSLPGRSIRPTLSRRLQPHSLQGSPKHGSFFSGQEYG